MATPSRRLLAWQILTLALLVVGYTGCYLCRSNFSVTLPLIKTSLVAQGYTELEARLWLGRTASLGVLAYAIGKFVTGSMADLLGGRRNVLVGMLGSVVFTILLAASGSAPLVALAWVANSAVQSLCWTGMVKVTGRWFSFASYGTAMGIVSLSYLFGDAAARRFMGALLHAGLDWRQVFCVAAGGLFACFLLSAWLFKESPRDVGLEEPRSNPLNVFGPGDQDSQSAGWRELVVPLVTNPAFLVVCLLSLGLTLLRQTFHTWSAVYFTEQVGLPAAEAANASALVPLLGGASVLLAGWIGDRLGPRGRAAVILVGSLLTAVVLAMLGSHDFTNGQVLPVVLVSLVGFLMTGPYSYLAGAISLDLGGKRGSATACGIIDGVGYLGAILAGDSVARISGAWGWSSTFQLLATVALFTSLAAGVYFRLQPHVAAEPIHERH